MIKKASKTDILEKPVTYSTNIAGFIFYNVIISGFGMIILVLWLGGYIYCCTVLQYLRVY